jgi:hypothetical protein
MSKQESNLYFYVIAILILILSIININSYFPQKPPVLGVETKNTEGIFWYDFLQKHPNYIPGWIEIGRVDKAIEIDPNYF